MGKIPLERWAEPKHRGLKPPVSHVLTTVWLFTADVGHNTQGTKWKHDQLTPAPRGQFVSFFLLSTSP